MTNEKLCAAAEPYSPAEIYYAKVALGADLLRNIRYIGMDPKGEEIAVSLARRYNEPQHVVRAIQIVCWALRHGL